MEKKNPKTFNEEQGLHFVLLKLQSNWTGFSMNICRRQIRQSSSVIAHISSLSNIWRVSKPLKDSTYYFNQVNFRKNDCRHGHFLSHRLVSQHPEVRMALT